ncbi:MAG: hypothetical protein SFY66_10745 [Oculatellaceae cyanobacterium bins.114]|nr:hypothetical protein [Oculatellaceae cyanobacterium bins.114]
MQTTNGVSNAEKLVIGSLFAASFTMCVTASSAYHWLGGFSMWGVGEALRSRRKLEYVDVFRGSSQYLQEAIGDLNEVALPASQAIAQGKQRLVISALKQMPMGEKLADQFIAKQGLETDWFKGFEKRSAIVCGESKDGKTHLLLWRVQRFLQQHPDAEIYIADPDYGSSHEGADPNTWFNLPVGKVVFIEMTDIEAVIHMVAGEVATRARKTADAIKQGRSKPQFKPILLLVDEWISFKDSLEEKALEEIIKSLRNICNRGIKQGNVTFLLGLHDLSVGSSGIPRALLKLLEVLLLYRASQSKRNYDNLDTNQVDEVIRQMGNVPKVVKDLRPCVVFTDKALSVKALPALHIEQVEFVDEADEAVTDPDQEWFNQLWTSELEAKILKRMLERVSEGKQAIAITEFWVTVAGQSRKEMKATNQKYLLFKSKIEALGSGVPNPENSVKLGDGRRGETEGMATATDTTGFEESFENPFVYPETA